MNSEFPVAVIGAGPIGLAAAAHLISRGLEPIVLERGPSAGTALQAWGQVQVFSPWSLNIDAVANSLLEQTGWRTPDPNGLPTGFDLAAQYLTPLSRHPKIAPRIRYNATVTGISRTNNAGGAVKDANFLITWRDGTGAPQMTRAAAVLDASGTWNNPNPIGVDGNAVDGETSAQDKIDYGIPDILGRDRSKYEGKNSLVIGGGHSAINIVLDILKLREQQPQTRLRWALRRDSIDRLLGGELNARLPARAALGQAAQAAIDDGSVKVLAPFAAEKITHRGAGLAIAARCGDQPTKLHVDRIAVATGLRPDLKLLDGLRLDLDPAVEAPRTLAPMIDPALHSCGSVPPHGVNQLRQPEPRFFIVGSKSYGRAPTFLLATGYEQVRSVVAELAGDHAAAHEIKLPLPQTGINPSTALL